MATSSPPAYERPGDRAPDRPRPDPAGARLRAVDTVTSLPVYHQHAERRLPSRRPHSARSVPTTTSQHGKRRRMHRAQPPASHKAYARGTDTRQPGAACDTDLTAATSPPSVAALSHPGRCSRAAPTRGGARNGRAASVAAGRARAFAPVNGSERVPIPRSNRAATGLRLAGSGDLRLACDSIAAAQRKPLQIKSRLSQQIPPETSGICRYVLDCRFNLNQWRRWESNPRPRPRSGRRLRAYPALCVSPPARHAGRVEGGQPLKVSLARMRQSSRGEPAS